jgi:hypothetical protein
MSTGSPSVSPTLPAETDTEVQTPAERGRAAGEGEEGQAVEEVQEEEEEALPQKPENSPGQPTSSQVAQHELTHLNYRAWCPDCVEAFAREKSHRMADPSGRTIPLVSIDYCFMSEKGVHSREDVEYQWEDAPESVLKVLVGTCSKSKEYFAHAMPKKGLDDQGYASKCLAESVMALGHARCVIRSDNEPAILQLVRSAIGRIRQGGIDVVDEGSVPHDPQTNGRAEAAVHLMKGGIRVHQLSLERKLQSHIPIAHPLMTWLARHVGFLRTTQIIGPDGITAWQRTRGRPFTGKLHMLGEMVQYKCRAQENGIGGNGPRWSKGLWLGFDRRTTQHIVYDGDHKGIRHTRTLMSLPDAQKFDKEKAAQMSATPWSEHVADLGQPVFAEKEKAEPPAVSDAGPTVRNMYIKQEDLNQYGYTLTVRHVKPFKFMDTEKLRGPTQQHAGNESSRSC